MKGKIIKSILDILILQLLRNNSFNNNQIIMEINERFGVYINGTTINVTLTRLKNHNFIAQMAENTYTLTEQGKQARAKMKRDYLELQSSIAQGLGKE